MPRARCGGPLAFLVLSLALVWPLIGCGNQPDEPAPPAPQEQAELDVKPILREFLRTLPADWHLVSAQEAAAGGPFWVDVREPGEYAEGFIEGAVNIGIRELAKNLEALPGLDADIVLACDTGHRSAVGMAVLRMLGYRNVRALEGGLQAWRDASLALVTTPVPPPAAGPAAEVDPGLRAAFDYYLGFTLPVHWGAVSLVGLTEDQNRKSSAELEAQPETFDQGRSLLVDIDEPEEFAKAGLEKSINAPLRRLPDELDNMPLVETIQYA